VLIVSGDFPHVKFSFLRLVHQNGIGLPKLVMAEAVPCPLFRFEHESTLHRILMHVPKLLRTLVFGEYHEIVEAALPDMALFQSCAPQITFSGVATPKSSHEVPGEPLFNGLDHDRWILALWFAKEHMDMLWHDDVSDDREAISSANLLQEFEK